MASERTLSIIKPDATRRNLTGAINDRFEKAGLRIVAQKRLQLTRAQAEAFYAVHRERPFFGSLVEFMTSGPVVAQVLEGEGAVARNREVMGATDPAKAAAGTIRKDFAEGIEANSVHGSDSAENAAVEIAFFFAGTRSSAEVESRADRAVGREEHGGDLDAERRREEQQRAPDVLLLSIPCGRARRGAFEMVPVLHQQLSALELSDGRASRG
jgi:nucleoside-diphosphate kinase